MNSVSTSSRNGSASFSVEVVGLALAMVVDLTLDLVEALVLDLAVVFTGATGDGASSSAADCGSSWAG
ncbi:hypothetical protein WICPIJ_005432 [Wickerhamomyces pijperi]|uniref:Uncharacterized protein n=1 Tax=Wickerhamomyces pijperi TaxID=599730 RepID=A0A9P8TLZ3_WICPI|nr:hypothetical protein WICPIJ_005432 [Wickerhamomyces pijperi]